MCSLPWAVGKALRDINVAQQIKNKQGDESRPVS
jgi:hypothetical protein